VRSSTSSSNARLPASRWNWVLGGAALAFPAFVGLLELRLALRGFQPTVSDSEARWIEQRSRASRLGERALILVGSSRLLLDADLDLLRERTGLEPVQLAIDGSSFRPVLAGLAADATVRGAVIVDFADRLLVGRESDKGAARWQAAFERERGRTAVPDFERSERWLTDAWRQRLRSYADGGRPLTALRERVLRARPTPQYLVMRPDRSRLADYAQLNMRMRYLARVLRDLGDDPPPGMQTLDELEQYLRSRVDTLTPSAGSLEAYLRASRELAAQTAIIQARGGSVYFTVLPKSGLVRELDARRYPRAQFWDRFAEQVGAPTLHFEDIPAWRRLECPDGSHLDFRQRAEFTAALADAIVLARSAAVPPRAR